MDIVKTYLYETISWWFHMLLAEDCNAKEKFRDRQNKGIQQGLDHLSGQGWLL